jgi:hypothetical protein
MKGFEFTTVAQLRSDLAAAGFNSHLPLPDPTIE